MSLHRASLSPPRHCEERSNLCMGQSKPRFNHGTDRHPVPIAIGMHVQSRTCGIAIARNDGLT